MRSTPRNPLLPLELGQFGKQLEGIPTWVPSWTVSLTAYITVRPNSGDFLFSAGQDKMAWARLGCDVTPLGEDTDGGPVDFSFSADVETLVMRALVVDRIANASPVQPDADRVFRVRRALLLKRAGPKMDLYNTIDEEEPGFLSSLDRWTNPQHTACEEFKKWEVRAFAHPCSLYPSQPALRDAL